MKTNLFKTKILAWVLMMLSFFGNNAFGQAPTVVEFTPSSSTQTWTVPNGAVIDVEVWGKGADGTDGGGSEGGKGGGGGGYAFAKGLKNISSIKYGPGENPGDYQVEFFIGVEPVGIIKGLTPADPTEKGGEFYQEIYVSGAISGGSNGQDAIDGTGEGGSGGKGGGPNGGSGGFPVSGSSNGKAPGGGGAGRSSVIESPAGEGGAGLVRITYTIPPSITTTFNQVPPICKGATLAALPTTSTNMPLGITGTWLPAINNMATTTYTFTPTPGQDASIATMTIVVNAPTAPTATTPQYFCQGQKVVDLVATGTALKWYNAASGGSELAETDVLTATTYYVSQTVNGCESDRTPVVVTLKAGPSVQANAITTSPTACNIGTIRFAPSRFTDNTVLIDESLDGPNPSVFTIHKDAANVDGFVKLTRDENSKNGQLLFAKTSTAPKAFELNFHTFMLNKFGADGFSVNYGEIGDVQSLQEDGQNTGLVLRFKTYNQDRIQLVYNNLQIGSDYNLNLEDGNWYSYSLTVTEDGKLTLKRIKKDEPNSPTENIFSNVQLPNTYNTTNDFQWAFAGRTGGEKNEHIIDGVKFTDKTPLQFSYDQTNWQPGDPSPMYNTFTNVPAGLQTVYVRSGNTGCPASLVNGSITVVGTPPPTPTFTPIATICKGATLDPLPTTSTNGYTGTWEPALNNMATTTYTFTPAAGECASTATMTITVNEPVTPTFNGNSVVLDKRNSSIPNSGTFPVTTSATYRIEVWGKGGNGSGGGFGGGYSGKELILLPDRTYNFNVSPVGTSFYDDSQQIISIVAYGATNNIAGGGARGTKNITGGSPSPSYGGGAAGWWGHDGASLNGSGNSGGDSGTPDNSSDGGDEGQNGKFPGGGAGGNGGVGAEGRILITKIEPIITTYCKGATMNPLPTTSVEGITGTWAPELNNQATTTYTFTPDGGQCASSATLEIVINEPTTPTFTQIEPICKGAPLAALPTTSDNGVSGTWAPAVMDNQTTTTYTFTPNASVCATTTTMTIVVNDVPLAPTVSVGQNHCAGSTVADLVATGTNLKWYYNANDNTAIDPSVILSSAILFYHVSQTVNGCESSKKFVNVTINPKETPIFEQIAPICKDASLAALPTTSDNNIPGSWSPSFNNQATTTYTFTPNAGQCANSATMTVVVNNCSVISGTVYEDADGGTIGGTPLSVSGAYLSIYPATITTNFTTIGVPPTPQPLHVMPITMGTGAYTFPELPDGRYKIVIGTSASGSETPSFPNVGNFSMTYGAEGEAGTAGDGVPDGITYVTISADAPIYDGGNGRVRADAGISFAIKQLAPLPVRLISFSGKNTEKGNELTWKTSSEINFSHFEVEKSSDAKKFEKIGKVDSSSSETYEFLDSTPPLGAGGLYRLKMVDLDGTFAYSKIIALNTQYAENSIGQIYPNPSNGEAKVNISTNESGNWTVNTFDITGKLIGKETLQLHKGINQLELKKLSTGLNYIQISDGKNTEVRKVIKN